MIGLPITFSSKPTLCLGLLLALLAVLASTSSAQAPAQPVAGIPPDRQQREVLARAVLLQVQASPHAFDPISHALLLYRSAGAWAALDSAQAIRVYREAFAEARLGDPPWRNEAEQLILNDLLPLSPGAALDLLPNAEPDAKLRLYAAQINFSLFQDDRAAAHNAFDQAVANGVLPQ